MGEKRLTRKGNPVTLYLSKDDLRVIALLCESWGMSRSAVVRALLQREAAKIESTKGGQNGNQ